MADALSVPARLSQFQALQQRFAMTYDKDFASLDVHIQKQVASIQQEIADNIRALRNGDPVKTVGLERLQKKAEALLARAPQPVFVPPSVQPGAVVRNSGMGLNRAFDAAQARFVPKRDVGDREVLETRACLNGSYCDVEVEMGGQRRPYSKGDTISLTSAPAGRWKVMNAALGAALMQVCQHAQLRVGSTDSGWVIERTDEGPVAKRKVKEAILAALAMAESAPITS